MAESCEHGNETVITKRKATYYNKKTLFLYKIASLLIP
jgi:hypothetical protein